MPSITLIEDNAPPPASKPLIQEVVVGDSTAVETSQAPHATVLVATEAEDKTQKTSASQDPLDADVDAKAKQEAARLAEFKKKHPNPLTKKFLKQHCKDLKLYSTPALNDVLYLHYKGIYEIENLEDYVGLKCLWLENNGIKVIQNLDHQGELRCLYLQHNLIERLQNLEPLQKLDTLNVSNNLISRIENLSCMPQLHTLSISHNKLHTVEDIQHLTECHELSILDVSHNKLDDPAALDVFSQMTNLRVLTLTGNQMIREVKHYRKTFIVNCKNLQYLDDRPVSDKERACAVAWSVGGLDAEKAERKVWQDRENKKILDSVEALMKVRRRNEAKRIEEELNTKNAEEGKTERVEVDEESVDWLTGSYRIKGEDVTRNWNTCEMDGTEETADKDKSEQQATVQNANGQKVSQEDLPVISRKSEDETESIFSSSSRKSPQDEGTRIMITQMKDQDSDQEDPEDLPELEDVEIVPAEASKGSFKPKIEVLDDSDGSDDNDEEESTQLFSAGKQRLIEEISTTPSPQSHQKPSSPKTGKQPLIEEVTAPASPARKQKPLITEIQSPPPHDQTSAVVSPDEICLETKREPESDRLLQELGAISQASMVKTGVIDTNQNQDSSAASQDPVSDLEKVERFMSPPAANSRSDATGDGLGELD